MSSSRDDFGIAIRSALLKKGARQKFSLVFLLIIATIIFLLDTYQFKFIKLTKVLINDGIYRLTNISTAPFKLLPTISEKIKEFHNRKAPPETQWASSREPISYDNIVVLTSTTNWLHNF